jgi:hypothetical protein
VLTLINGRVLPPEVVPHELARPISLFTGGGTVALCHGVYLHTLRFPELSPTRSSSLALMLPTGIDSNQTILWNDLSVLWQSPESLNDRGFPPSLKQVMSHLSRFDPRIGTGHQPKLHILASAPQMVADFGDMREHSREGERGKKRSG